MSSTSVNFFKEGFFGYSDETVFHLWSFWHFLPIVIMIVSIILIYKYRDKIRNSKYETTIRYVLAFVMLMVEMSYFWRLLYVGAQGKHETMMNYLPLQMCQWGLIICVFTLLSKNKKLFSINFYVSLLFTPLALIYPFVIAKTGPTYYRYYQYWLEHILPIVCIFYLMFVHRLKPDYKGIYKTLILIVPLSIFSIIANVMVPDANYLYLRQNVPVLPKELYYRVPILYVVVYAVFNLMYFIYYKIDNKKKKVS